MFLILMILHGSAPLLHSELCSLLSAQPFLASASLSIFLALLSSSPMFLAWIYSHASTATSQVGLSSQSCSLDDPELSSQTFFVIVYFLLSSFWRIWIFLLEPHHNLSISLLHHYHFIPCVLALFSFFKFLHHQ